MQIKLQARLIKYDSIDAIVFYFHELVQRVPEQEFDCINLQHQIHQNSNQHEVTIEDKQNQIIFERSVKSSSD